MNRPIKGHDWIGALAALISIIAGVYLLTSQSASAETTVFDALMHGIGGYCIARGVWMIYSMVGARQSDAVESQGAGPKSTLQQPSIFND